jgi:plasmid stabilization system protein ParE
VKKLKVYLSPIAESKLNELLLYLVEEWSVKSKTIFLKKLKQKTTQISVHPKSCVQSEAFPGLFRLVIEKHISLYYRINGDEIEIITIIDNRQNPESVNREIENIAPNKK